MSIKKIEISFAVKLFVTIFLMIFFFVLLGTNTTKQSDILTSSFLDLNRNRIVQKLPVIEDEAITNKPGINDVYDYEAVKQYILSVFGASIPFEWGEKITGVKSRLNTNDKIIALTFDACGGSGGSGYDKELIDYLKTSQISATLFLSGSWVDKNKEIAKDLSQDPLFEIENHGLTHKPCSINGKSAYNILGTKNIGEVVDEIEKNAKKIEAITGKKTSFYRSGTAYYDEVCVAIANELGYQVAGFSIAGDGGAKFSIDQIKKTLSRATPGSIFLFHMNHPQGKTFEGIKETLPILKDQGYSFVRLSEFPLQ
ncbi:MAG: polysaccharide deacetylase family protein [Candidatus Paceibacterota bacterium]|jgi:peptidoglycan/xylan/chitin deacetylase (PgdA/CDA1 family)